MEADRSSDVLEIDRPNKLRKIIGTISDRSSGWSQNDRFDYLRLFARIISDQLFVRPAFDRPF